MKLVTGISIANYCPRFRDDSSQCFSYPELSTAILSAELYEITDNTIIECSKDGVPIVPDTRRRLKVTANIVQLALDNVQKEDGGIYKITAKSPNGSLASRDIELRITNNNSNDSDESPAFLRRLNDLSVKIGTRTRFLVEIRSNLNLLIEWYHNEALVEEGDRYRFVNEGSFHCIDVAPVTIHDNGRWTCLVRNDFGQTSSSCNLNVLVPKTYKSPEFLEELRALLTEQGTVSLECKVVGVPTPLLRWFKDGKEIHAGDLFALTASPDDLTTLGTYVCEAVNCMGKAYSSSKVQVVGKDSHKCLLKPSNSSIPSGPPPIFIRELQDDNIAIGDPLILSCQVSVPPWPKSVVWYNSESRIDENGLDNRYKILVDGIGGYTIEVKPTEVADGGEWKCVATSINGTVSISVCNVSMSIPKHYRKPRFMDSLKAVLTEEGLVSFECKVVGSPTPFLRWFKDEQELKPGDVYQLTGTNSLGSYCCIAKNCMGEARSSAELTVEDIQSQLNDEERAQLVLRNQAPKFLHGLQTCETKINEPFQFSVQISVRTPLPNLFWYRDNVPISNESNRYQLERENLGVSHLNIICVEFIDQAEWKCVATNEFGHSVTSCFLKLIIPKYFKKPRFLECLRAVLSDEGAVNLECKVIGVPQPVLKWYKDGVELKPGDIHKITSGEDGMCCLGIYTCEARNCMGVVASSASLLGFEEQKSRIQQRIEMTRQTSLSTIHEERTSQMYDTAGDQSLTIDDKGEVSFSFDGKEVSVSLYETPDLTEEEAIKVVEMYADQLSEHVSEHNVVELPPLRFVKEISTSGNLLVEAIVVDVSEDYFTSEEHDLRTEADIDEIYSLSDETGEVLSPIASEKLKIDFSSNSESPKRPPRKSDSQKTNLYYSLSKHISQESNNGEDSLAMVDNLDSESYGDYESAISSEKMKEQKKALQIAAITEIVSLPDDDIDNRRSLTPCKTHEIGSDLRVNRSESNEIKKIRRFSQGTDEISNDNLMIKKLKRSHSLDSVNDIYKRDVQGEEGDGLIIDPELNAAKQLELREEELLIIEELKMNILDIQHGLFSVEEKLLQQSSLKSTSATANKSLEVLSSILQPFKDINTVLDTMQNTERNHEICAVELIAPPIFELQKNLGIVVKCVEIQGKQHTLIQQTCDNILDTTNKQLQQSLNLIHKITLIEKELDTTKTSGRMTPSKIIQEVCITIKEMQSTLEKANNIVQNKNELKSKSKINLKSRITLIPECDDILLKILKPTEELHQALTNLENSIVYEDNDEFYVNLHERILEKITTPIEVLYNEISNINKQFIKHSNEKSQIQEIRLVMAKELHPPIIELYKGLDTIKKYKSQGLHSGPIFIKILESFVDPIEVIFNCIEKIKLNSTTLIQTNDTEMRSIDVEDVFDQVTNIVFNNIRRLSDDFLFNIEAAQKYINDTIILEALRQLSTLQKDLSTTISKISDIKTEETINTIECLVQPLEILNKQLSEIQSQTTRDILDDIVGCLTLLKDNIIVDDTILKILDLSIPFSILKDRTIEVRENICSLTEHGTVLELLIDDSLQQGDTIILLEEQPETVVLLALIEDTQNSISTIQKYITEHVPELTELAILCLKDLQEIINDPILLKKRGDLKNNEKITIENYVILLEHIEDLLIDAQENLNERASTSNKNNDEIKGLLEHLQYNVGIMHQQIIEESLKINDEQITTQQSIENLKNSIDAIQNLPIISEIPETDFIISTATKQTIIKSINDLYKCLTNLQNSDILENTKQLYPKLFQNTSEITEYVEKLKENMSLEKDNPMITLEQVTFLKSLIIPLEELHKNIEHHQESKENRLKSFLILKKSLIELINRLDEISNEILSKIVETWQEPLDVCLEVVDLEENNYDIEESDYESLQTVAKNLNDFNKTLPKEPIDDEESYKIIAEMKDSVNNLNENICKIDQNSGIKYIIKALKQFIDASKMSLSFNISKIVYILEDINKKMKIYENNEKFKSKLHLIQKCEEIIQNILTNEEWNEINYSEFEQIENIINIIKNINLDDPSINNIRISFELSLKNNQISSEHQQIVQQLNSFNNILKEILEESDERNNKIHNELLNSIDQLIIISKKMHYDKFNDYLILLKDKIEKFNTNTNIMSITKTNTIIITLINCLDNSTNFTKKLSLLKNEKLTLEQSLVKSEIDLILNNMIDNIIGIYENEKIKIDELKHQKINKITKIIKDFGDNLNLINYSDINRNNINELNQSLEEFQQNITKCYNIQLNNNELKIFEQLCDGFHEQNNYLMEKLTLNEYKPSEIKQTNELVNLFDLSSKEIENPEMINFFTSLTMLKNSIKNVLDDLNSVYSQEVKVNLVKNLLIKSVNQSNDLNDLKENLNKFEDICKNFINEDEQEFLNNSKNFIDLLIENKDSSLMESEINKLQYLIPKLYLSPLSKILTYLLDIGKTNLELMKEENSIVKIRKTLMDTLKDFKKHYISLKETEMSEKQFLKITDIIDKVHNLETYLENISTDKRISLTNNEIKLGQLEEEILNNLHKLSICVIYGPEEQEILHNIQLNREEMKSIIMPDQSELIQIGQILEYTIDDCIDMINMKTFDEIIQPLIDSLENLQKSITAIEQNVLLEDKKLAIYELRKLICTTENTIKINLEKICMDLNNEEKIVIEAVNKTLNEILNYVLNSENIEFETIGNLPKISVETVKTSIEELKLKILTIGKQSKVKDELELLEKTAKNTINLMERISEKNECKIKIFKTIEELQNKINSIDIKKLPNDKVNILKNLKKSIDNLIQSIENISINRDSEENSLDLINNCLQKLDLYFNGDDLVRMVNKNNSRYNFDEIKNAFSNCITNVNETSNNNLKTIVNFLKLIIEESNQLLTPKIIECASLKSLQNSLVNIQESLEIQPEEKVQMILVNELKRPLTTIQYIAGSIFEDRKEKFSADNLYLLDTCTNFMENLNIIIEECLEQSKTDQINNILEQSDKLKILIASINQESSIKEMIEPLQDILKTLEKAHERAIIMENKEVIIKQQTATHLKESLKNLKEFISVFMENPAAEIKYSILHELQKPLQALVDNVSSVDSSLMENIEVNKLNNLIESVEQINLNENLKDKLKILQESISIIPPSHVREESVDILEGNYPFCQAIGIELKNFNLAICTVQNVVENIKSSNVDEEEEEGPIKLESIDNLITVIQNIENISNNKINLLLKLINPLRDFQNQIINSKISQEEFNILENINTLCDSICVKINNLQNPDIIEYKDLLNDLEKSLSNLQTITESQPLIYELINIQSEIGDIINLRNILKQINNEYNKIKENILEICDNLTIRNSIINLLENLKNEQNNDFIEIIIQKIKSNLEDLSKLDEENIKNIWNLPFVKLYNYSQEILKIPIENCNVNHLEQLYHAFEDIINIKIKEIKIIRDLNNLLKTFEINLQELLSKEETISDYSRQIKEVIKELAEPVDKIKKIPYQKEDLENDSNSLEILKKIIDKLSPTLLPMLENFLQEADLNHDKIENFKNFKIFLNENLQNIQNTNSNISHLITDDLHSFIQKIEKIEKLAELSLEVEKLNHNNIIVLENIKTSTNNLNYLIKSFVDDLKMKSPKNELIQLSDLNEGLEFLSDSINNLESLIKTKKLIEFSYDDLKHFNHFKQNIDDFLQNLKTISDSVNLTENKLIHNSIENLNSNCVDLINLSSKLVQLEYIVEPIKFLNQILTLLQNNLKKNSETKKIAKDISDSISILSQKMDILKININDEKVDSQKGIECLSELNEPLDDLQKSLQKIQTTDDIETIIPTIEENIENLNFTTGEFSNIISNLNESFEEVSSQEENFKKVLDNLIHKLDLIHSTIPQSKQLEIITLPITKLVAKLSDTKEIIIKKSQMEKVIQSILNVENNIELLKGRVDELKLKSENPLISLIEIEKPLENLKEAIIQDLKSIPFENLKKMEEPLEDLFKIVENVTKYDKDKLELHEITIKLNKIKCSLMSINDPLETKIIQNTSNALLQLNEEISQIEKNLNNFPKIQELSNTINNLYNELPKMNNNLLNELIQPLLCIENYLSTMEKECFDFPPELQTLNESLKHFASFNSETIKNSRTQLRENMQNLKLQLNILNNTNIPQQMKEHFTNLLEKIIYVENKLKNEEISSEFKKVRDEIIVLQQETKNFNEKIKNVDLVINQKKPLSKLDEPLSILQNDLQKIQSEIDGKTEEMFYDCLEQIDVTLEPVKKLTKLFVEMQTILNKPNIQKTFKTDLQSFESQITILNGTAAQQTLKIFEIPLNKLSGKISEIFNDFNKQAKVIVQNIVLPIKPLVENIQSLSQRAEETSLLSLIEPLEELYSTLNTIETENYPLEDINNLETINQPLQTFSATIEESLNKTEIQNEEIIKLHKAIKGFKCKIEDNLKLMSDTQSLNIVNIKLEKLSSNLSNVEDQLKKSEKISVVQPLKILSQTIDSLKLNIEDSKSTEHGELSITNINQPLKELEIVFEKIESNYTDKNEDILFECSNLVNIIKEPIKNICTILNNDGNILIKPKIENLPKVELCKALKVFRQKLDILSQEIPKIEFLKVATLPVKQLSAQLSEIENTIKDDLNFIKLFKQNLKNVSDNLNIIEEKNKNKPIKGGIHIIKLIEENHLLLVALENMENYLFNDDMILSVESGETIKLLNEGINNLLLIITKIKNTNNNNQQIIKDDLLIAINNLIEVIDKSLTIPSKFLENTSSFLKKFSCKLFKIKEDLENEKELVRILKNKKSDIEFILYKVQVSEFKIEDLNVLLQQGIQSVIEMEKPLTKSIESSDTKTIESEEKTENNDQKSSKKEEAETQFTEKIQKTQQDNLISETLQTTENAKTDKMKDIKETLDEEQIKLKEKLECDFKETMEEFKSTQKDEFRNLDEELVQQKNDSERDEKLEEKVDEEKFKITEEEKKSKTQIKKIYNDNVEDIEQETIKDIEKKDNLVEEKIKQEEEVKKTKLVKKKLIDEKLKKNEEGKKDNEEKKEIAEEKLINEKDEFRNLDEELVQHKNDNERDEKLEENVDEDKFKITEEKKSKTQIKKIHNDNVEDIEQETIKDIEKKDNLVEEKIKQEEEVKKPKLVKKKLIDEKLKKNEEGKKDNEEKKEIAEEKLINEKDKLTKGKNKTNKCQNTEIENNNLDKAKQNEKIEIQKCEIKEKVYSDKKENKNKQESDFRKSETFENCKIKEKIEYDNSKSEESKIEINKPINDNSKQSETYLDDIKNNFPAYKENTSEINQDTNRKSESNTKNILLENKPLFICRDEWESCNLEVFKPTSYHGPRFCNRKPIFGTALTNRTVSLGCRIKLTCSFINPENLHITWLKDGKTLDNSDRNNITFSDGLATLEILCTTLDDEGEYSCVVKNEHGVSTSSSNITILDDFQNKSIIPTFTRPIKDHYEKEQNQLILESTVRCPTTSTIYWCRDGTKISYGAKYQQKYSADGICKLIIKNPDDNDIGKYTCSIIDKNSKDEISHDVTFNSIPRKLEFTGYSMFNKVPCGGHLGLQVAIKGDAEVSWFKEDQKLLKTSGTHKSFYEKGVHTLFIPNVSIQETGRYTCKAANNYGQIQTSSFVHVVNILLTDREKPAMFLSRPETIMDIHLCSDISVSCRVTGNPKPIVTWMKGIQDISGDLRSLKETSDDYIRFTLKRATADDMGTYCILAKNCHGCDRAFFTVRPRIRPRSVTPTRDIQNISNFSNYQEKKYVTNIPSPIVGEPMIEHCKENRLIISWKNSDSRGSVPLVFYKVEAWLRGNEGARWKCLSYTPLNSLDITDLKQGGEYQFRITPQNRYGCGEPVQTKTITIGKTIKLPQFIRILPGQIKALMGSSIVLECHTNPDSAPDIHWYKDSCEVQSDFNSKLISYEDNIAKLIIKEVKESDSGRFTCEAQNSVGKASTYTRLFITDNPNILKADENLKMALKGLNKTNKLTPQFTMRLRDRRVQISYPVRLTCQVAAMPEPQIVWIKDGKEIQENEHFTFWIENYFYTLEINKATLSDSGVYSITAKNPHGSVSCHCNLIVDKGLRAYVTPEFVCNLEPAHNEIKEGSQLILTGKVKAYPTVGIMWYRNGTRLRPSRNSVMSLYHDGRIELNLASLTKRDMGTYTCVATNEVGRAESNARVRVFDNSDLTTINNSSSVTKDNILYSKEPKFLKKPINTEAFEGDNIVIICEVIGDPKPEVTWLRDFLKPDYYRDSSQFHRIGEGPEYRLEIPNAKLDYTGTYTVSAKNCHGDTKAIISLQIKVKPTNCDNKMDEKHLRIGDTKNIPIFTEVLKDIRCCDGDSASLECKIKCSGRVEVSWEKQGKLIHQCDDFNYEFDGETAKLVIKKVFPEDEGEYTCIVQNELGKRSTTGCLLVDLPEEKENLLSTALIPVSTTNKSGTNYSRYPHRQLTELPTLKTPIINTTFSGKYQRHRITGALPPTFYTVIHNCVAEEGETIKFQCIVSGHPNPYTTWEKDDVQLSITSRIRITENEDLRTLEIRNIKLKDTGVYKILLTNISGTNATIARLDVIPQRSKRTEYVRARSLSPKNKRITPYSAKIGPHTRLMDDYQVNLCLKPFNWYQDSIEINHYDKYKYVIAINKSLDKFDLDNYDSVYYVGNDNNCDIIENRCLKIIPNRNINIPIISKNTYPLSRLQIIETQPLIIIWLKNSKLISMYCNYYQIRNVQIRNENKYKCEPYNYLGMAITKCYINVRQIEIYDNENYIFDSNNIDKNERFDIDNYYDDIIIFDNMNITKYTDNNNYINKI